MLEAEAPILLITFNRPDTTQQVFEVIKAVRPKKLYIFSDGPRESKLNEDMSKIAETRKIFEEINWDCQVERKFNVRNEGCGKGVSGAINWIFETEESAIILEDDCVPSISFFTFCNILLHKYAGESKVMHITGTRWNEEFIMNDCDYFFSKYAHIWGWATWKRAWDQYDFYMTDWPLFVEKKLLENVLGNNFPLVKRWKYLFNKIYNLSTKHTWDYQWQYAVFKNNGLCITPNKNLITNIGEDGTHANITMKTNAYYRTNFEIDQKLNSPLFFHPEYNFDDYHGRNFFLNDRGRIKVAFDWVMGVLFSLLNR